MNKSVEAFLRSDYLNLPEQVVFTSGASIEYDYDASGVKLRKRYITSSGTTTTTTTTTDYLGRFQYINANLEFFAQSEGYVKYDLATSQSQYVYNYTDHLGNIRVTYSDLDDNGSISQSEILKENNYYPFGMLHQGYNNSIHPYASSFTYGYGGKEHQEEAGIDWIDFGSRNYDASLGRWFNLDPQAERYNGISPYAAMANNPIYFSDPNGEELLTAVIVGAIAGAAIGATTAAITNPKATFGDILKGGVIGAISGAVTGGIGDAGLQAVYAAGAHGVFQGSLSAVQGGDFWQAAAIAVVSSTIATGVGDAGQAAVEAGTRTTTEVAVAQALSGSFVGGFSSQISGGSFTEGFATGLTVAGLNHALHSLAQAKTIRQALDDADIDPDGVPKEDISEVEMLIDNVDEIGRLYKKGNSPKLNSKILPRNATIDGGSTFAAWYNENNHTVTYTQRAFTSYFKLASVTGHELNHSIDWTTGLVQKWRKVGLSTAKARAFSEFRAYRWQTQWGDSGARGYANDFFNKIKAYRNILTRNNLWNGN